MLTRKQKWRMTIKRVDYNNIYKQIDEEIKIKKNMVVFNNIVNVILIPKVEENDYLIDHYWWSKDDIDEFKENYIKYLKESKESKESKEKYSTI